MPGRSLFRVARFTLMAAVCCVFAAGLPGCSPEEGIEAIGGLFGFGGGRATSRPSIEGVVSGSPKNVNHPQGPTIMSHKPFVDGRCRECHEDPSTGNTIMIRVESKTCLKCHAKLLEAYPAMHGAVAARACLWCHEGHESAEPWLLRTRDQSLCFQCHERRQLTMSTAGHKLDKVVCVNCHSGHGGDEIPFLKPSVLNPVIRPKSPPGE